MKKRINIPTQVFVVFLPDGYNYGVFLSEQEALDDLWGPRFRNGATIVEYVRKPGRAKKVKGEDE